MAGATEEHETHIGKDKKFYSDKHPELGADKLALSFKDPMARRALRLYAELTADKQLAKDILARCQSIEDETIFQDPPLQPA